MGRLLKKKDDSWRFIHRLSYPADFSVKDFIDPEAFSVHYISLDAVLKMAGTLGKGAVLGKIDVKLAFDCYQFTLQITKYVVLNSKPFTTMIYTYQWVVQLCLVGKFCTF